VLCPAFVADCLETLEEIGLRADEDFRRHGGMLLKLVPSLNADPAWIEAVAQIARESVPSGWA
jgi:ferrochelatase